MNREIKFRVWDKSCSSWIGPSSTDWMGTGIGNVGSPDEQPWKCLSFKGEVMSNDNMGGFVDSNQDMFVIQQFSGLKDKNGRDIYEGDIINYHPHGVKGYENTKAKVPALTAFHWFQELETMMEIEGQCDVEIIGNIFENPELCKEK